MAEDIKEKEKISVRNFQMWLDGFCDGRDDKWRPSLPQWKKIVEKIALLEEGTDDGFQNSQPRMNNNFQPSFVGGFAPNISMMHNSPMPVTNNGSYIFPSDPNVPFKAPDNPNGGSIFS